MPLGNGTRSVPPSHIEIVAESLCGWACLRESFLIGGSKVARGRGYEIEDFLHYGFGGNVYVMSKRLCCGWSMALRDTNLPGGFEGKQRAMTPTEEADREETLEHER
ncbi:hypothetical protein TNCV_2317791 [Trichonephila clavipes]|nr:hypothetical protein TNCV_2317791 [Trichonephila clavipes]